MGIIPIWLYVPAMASVEIMTIAMAMRGGEPVEADVHDLDPEFYRIVVRRGPGVLELLEHVPMSLLGGTLERLDEKYGAGEE